nr:RNA-directed DNA polymerase, eukaryota, reverse transcriptase zinc-binding domain protein [Tanacetum cinerariifolium]
PIFNEASNWSKDLIKYFKDQWEIDRLKEQEDQDNNMEDIYENEEGKESKQLWISNDIQDSIDCVNEAEMEDLCSNGVFYTWIKSLLNSKNSVLKNLDRAVVNEELIMKFSNANALFLPYLIFDHSPMVVNFP